MEVSADFVGGLSAFGFDFLCYEVGKDMSVMVSLRHEFGFMVPGLY